MLAENLRVLRKKHKLSQQKFASILNVTQGAVSQWQLGTTRPSNEQLVSIAAKFGCSIDELVGTEALHALEESGDTQYKKFLYLFSMLPPDQQEHVQQYMRFVLHLESEKQE